MKVMQVANYRNFQSDNMKYDYKDRRTDIYNPEFNSTVSSKGTGQNEIFMKNLPKWVEFISWCR